MMTAVWPYHPPFSRTPQCTSSDFQSELCLDLFWKMEYCLICESNQNCHFSSLSMSGSKVGPSSRIHKVARSLLASVLVLASVLMPTPSHSTGRFLCSCTLPCHNSIGRLDLDQSKDLLHNIARRMSQDPFQNLGNYIARSQILRHSLTA